MCHLDVLISQGGFLIAVPGVMTPGTILQRICTLLRLDNNNHGSHSLWAIYSEDGLHFSQCQSVQLQPPGMVILAPGVGAMITGSGQRETDHRYDMKRILPFHE